MRLGVSYVCHSERPPPGTVLYHHSTDDPECMSAQYVEQSRMWFDSIWNTVARELKR